MSPPQPSIGALLIQRGWRQGCLLPATGHAYFDFGDDVHWQLIHTEPKEEEYLIVVSQDCDIVASSEPCVEAAHCYWVKSGSREFNGSISGNSSRYLLIREEGTGRERKAFIVDATLRAQVAKVSLLKVEPTFPETPRGAHDFTRSLRRFLGGRYSRPPLEPEVVEYVQKPIVAAVGDLLASDSSANRVVREIRMTPVSGPGPFNLDLILLLADGVSTSDERVLELQGALLERFQNTEDGTSLAQCVSFRPEDLSVRDYENSLKVPLDSFSWSGHEETGVPPLSGLDHG